MKEKIKHNQIQEFESKIKEYEDVLFGINLYYQGILLTWKSIPLIGKGIVKSNRMNYKSIEERMTTAINKAKRLLEAVGQSPNKLLLLQQFSFPPITGPGLSAKTKLVKALAEAYKEIFPGRPRSKPLTKEESQYLKIVASQKI